jgi:hypothetical protein
MILEDSLAYPGEASCRCINERRGFKDLIILFRAMSPDESATTLNGGRPSFIRKHKWFSTSFEFITGRVMDSKFNNSYACPERYCQLLQFTIQIKDLKYFSYLGRRELMLSVRQSHMIKWLAVQRIYYINIP